MLLEEGIQFHMLGPHAIAHLMNVNIETSHTEFLNILVSLTIVFILIFYRYVSLR